MGEWMESKEVDIMLTEMVVELDKKTVGEGEIIITMTGEGTEVVVVETIEEAIEAVIMEAEALWERVEAVAIPVKTIEVEEEIVPILQEVIVELMAIVIKMLITVGLP